MTTRHAFSARYQTHKSGRQTLYVEACWKAPHQKHVAYSVAKHGWIGAVTKAIQAREESQGKPLGIDPSTFTKRLQRSIR